MSDEAFARRFYCDRAELIALGVPLHSQRDEFTGEELYTLRSDEYFLPQLELEDEELAALQTALYLLEGQFAYAEPLRLALQNLALGRPGFVDAPTEAARASRCSTPTTRPRCPAGSRSSKARSRSSAPSSSTTGRSRATSSPSARSTHTRCCPTTASGTSSATISTATTSARSASRGSAATSSSRRGASATSARRRTSTSSSTAAGPPWQVGDIIGEARIEVRGDTAWWVQRTYGDTGRLEDGVFVTEYSSIPQLASWVLRQDGRAVPLEPDELRREVAASLRRVRERHEGKPPSPPARRRCARRRRRAERPPARSRPSASPCSRRCSRTCSPRCGEEQGGRRSRPHDCSSASRRSRPRSSRSTCRCSISSTSAAAATRSTPSSRRRGARRQGALGRHVPLPPRLTPLEARAIRLALEYVGPMIAADAHTPLDACARSSRRRSASSSSQQTPEPQVESEEEDLIADARARRSASSKLVEIEYQKEGEASRRRASSSRTRSSARCRTGTCTLGPHERRRALLPPRPDAQREADEGEVRAARRVRADAASRRRQRARALHAGDRALRDRARRAAARRRRRIAEISVGSDEWLESEILVQARRGDRARARPTCARRIAARASSRRLGVERCSRRSERRQVAAATAVPRSQRAPAAATA